MKRIFEIKGQRILSLLQTRELLPLIFRITDEAQAETRRLSKMVQALPDPLCSTALDLESRMDEIISRWNRKIERLGGLPKGLWLADFDNGDGYWCWKFPETDIQYYHGYQDGFSGRKMISFGHGEIHENRHSPDQPHPRGL